MIRNIKQINFILLFCCSALVTYCQQKDNSVRDMFDEPANIVWVRNMDGNVNDLHPIRVSLGFDGNMYKGKLTILGENITFDLTGTMDRERLVLHEIDSQGLHTGYLIGILEDDRFTAQWWSTDMSRSADIRLMDKGLILLKEFKPQMAILEGLVASESFHCILLIESRGDISGTWQRQNECVRFIGQCDDALCNQISLVVSEGELSGTRFHFNREKDDAYKVNIEFNSGSQFGEVRIVHDVPVLHRAQTDYNFIIDFTYPDIVEGGFNIWIKDKFNSWFVDALEEVSKSSKIGPDNRWSMTATAWIDVFLSTDQLVSGLLTMYNPKKRIYDRQPFIYSIGESRELGLDELSKKDRDILSELQLNIHVDGIDPGEFKYPVLTKSGFFVCTKFDAIEGDHSTMVSYSAIEKVIKRKSFFTKLTE